MTAFSPRTLDHLVLPTASLQTARARLVALGFTVAPAGIHPFGTENACVYLADGTFLEPLAVGDRTAADHAVGQGNVFVARDRAFRLRNGDDGFSAVVFASGDADADHDRFVKAGLSAGGRLDFSRPFVDAAGKQDIASFRLAFAADAVAPDVLFFTCERVNAPKVDRTALQSHANGATRIAAIVAVSDDIRRDNDLVAAIAEGHADSDNGSATEIALANAAIRLVDPAGFAREFGVRADDHGGLRLSAILFGAQSLAAVETLFKANGVQYRTTGLRLVVQPAAGQGAVLAFEEIS